MGPDFHASLNILCFWERPETASQTVDNVFNSLAEFAPAGAKKAGSDFCPEFISGQKYFYRRIVLGFEMVRSAA